MTRAVYLELHGPETNQAAERRLIDIPKSLGYRPISTVKLNAF